MIFVNFHTLPSAKHEVPLEALMDCGALHLYLTCMNLNAHFVVAETKLRPKYSWFEHIDVLSTCKIISIKTNYYPGQKNRYSRDIHEIDPPCNHVKLCDIDFDLRREFATRSLASCVDVEPKLDIAQYHMIKLQMNLMNFSAVTIFLASVEDCVSQKDHCKSNIRRNYLLVLPETSLFYLQVEITKRKDRQATNVF